MKRSEILSIRKVARDILHINCKNEDWNNAKYWQEFYKIMRKHGIKEGEWNKNGSGRLVANPEWSLFSTLLKSNIDSRNLLYHCFKTDVPEDLEAYGKRPKFKKVK